MSTFVDLYDYYCRRSHCRPNSQFLAYLREQCAKPPDERTLTDVDVSNSYIGKKGILPVLDLVKNVKTVVFLDVSSNMLEHEQLSHLVQCLLPHPSIARVVLRNNCLVETSANLLMDLLQGNASITEMDVDGNGFLPSTVARLAEQTARNVLVKARTREEQKQEEAIRAHNAERRWCAHAQGRLTEAESGGYINFATWWINPQYVLRVSHDSRVEIVMDVQNEILSRQAGFVLMRSNDTHPRRIHRIVTDTIVCESDMNCTHCRVETRLQHDTIYFVMPYMFQPQHGMDYTLRVAMTRERVTLEAAWATLELVDARYDWCTHTIPSAWTPSCAGGGGLIMNDDKYDTTAATTDMRQEHQPAHKKDQPDTTVCMNSNNSAAYSSCCGATYSNKVSPTWRVNNMFRLLSAPRSPRALHSTITVCLTLYKSVDPDCNDERSIGLDVVEPEWCYGGRPPLWYDPSLVRAHCSHERVTCVHLQFQARLSELDVYVVPSTALAGQTGSYTLVVFSSAPLQCIPSTFPHRWHHRIVMACWDEMSCGGSPSFGQSWKSNPAICIRTQADTAQQDNDPGSPCNDNNDCSSRAGANNRQSALMACLQPCEAGVNTIAINDTETVVDVVHVSSSNKNNSDENAADDTRTAAATKTVKDDKDAYMRTDKRDMMLPTSQCNRDSQSADVWARPDSVTEFQHSEANHDDHAALPPPSVNNKTSLTQPVTAARLKACGLAYVQGNLNSACTPCQLSDFSSIEAILRFSPVPTPLLYLVAMTSFAGELGSFHLHLFSTDPFVVQGGVQPLTQWERQAELTQHTHERAVRQHAYRTTSSSSKLSVMHACDSVCNDIVRECQSTGLMYSDRDFPRGTSSLWLDPQLSSPPHDFARTFTWIRSSELVKRTCRHDSLSAEDEVDQQEQRCDVFSNNMICLRHGQLSPPCVHSGRQHWFASVVQGLAAKPAWLARLFVGYHPSHGYAQFCFFKHHDWLCVTVDDYLAVDGTGSLCLGQSVDTADAFYPLIEKAYAKLHRCYEALERKVVPQSSLIDDFMYGLTDLSGGYCTRHAIRQPTNFRGRGCSAFDSSHESNNSAESKLSDSEAGGNTCKGGVPNNGTSTEARVSEIDPQQLWRTLKTVTRAEVHVSLVLRATSPPPAAATYTHYAHVAAVPTNGNGNSSSAAVYDKMDGVDLTGRSQVGLLPDRLYGVLDARWVEGQRLVQLRNWSAGCQTVWRGRWRQSSARWTDGLRHALQYFPSTSEDVIWLDLDEVVYYFTDMIVTTVYPYLATTTASSFAAAVNLHDPLCDNALLRNPQYALRFAESGSQRESEVGLTDAEEKEAKSLRKESSAHHNSVVEEGKQNGCTTTATRNDVHDDLIEIVIGLHQADSRMAVTRSKNATATYRHALGIVVFRTHDTTRRLTHVDQSQMVRFVSPQATRDVYCVVSVTPASIAELMIIPFPEHPQESCNVTFTMTARCAHCPAQIVLVKHNELQSIEGAWTRGCAGGPPSSYDWRNNKQYLLLPSESMEVCITLTRDINNTIDNHDAGRNGKSNNSALDNEDSCNNDNKNHDVVINHIVGTSYSSTSNMCTNIHDTIEKSSCAQTTVCNDNESTVDHTDSSGCEIGFTVHTTRRCNSILHFDSSSVVLHVPALPGNTAHSVSGTVRLLEHTTRRGMPYVIVPYCRRKDRYFHYTLCVSANKAVQLRSMDAALDWKRVDETVKVRAEDGSVGGSPAFPSWRCNPQRVVTFPLSCEGRLLLSATNVSHSEGAHHRIGLMVLRPDMRWQAGMRRKLTISAVEDVVACTSEYPIPSCANTHNTHLATYSSAATHTNGSVNNSVEVCTPSHVELDINLDALQLSQYARCMSAAATQCTRKPKKGCDRALNACDVRIPPPPDRLVVVVYAERPYLDVDIQLSLYATVDMTVAPVSEWHAVSIHEGGWDLGRTSGGSRAQYPSWANNPFFAIRTLRPTSMVALLIQYPRGVERRVVKRYGNKKAFLPPPIYNANNRISIELDLVHDDDVWTSVQRAGPTLDTELALTVQLDVCDEKPYLLVPSTSKSAEDADFKLLIYADQPIDVWPLEKKRIMYLP